MKEIISSILGILLLFVMTSLGSLLILFNKNKNNIILDNICIGIAGGIMFAASIFSLIIPSFEYSSMININKTIPVFVGLMLGSLFILIFDIIIVKMNKKNVYNKKLFLAMTLHNIPEGLAVGLTFGLALNHGNILSAFIFALGIAIQNFPEGFALSLPLYKETKNKTKAILLSMLSGSVEIIFGIIGLLLASKLIYLMPFSLCFGSGAMIYVVIDEFFTNSEKKQYKNISFVIGFLIMLILDVSFS